MSIVAVIPIANMASANTTLLSAGFGPNNFSVAAFGSSGITHAALHSWDNSLFESTLSSIPGVTVDRSVGDPISRTRLLIESLGARWGENAPTLPTSGNAIAGTLYTYGNNELWWCIQTFDRSTFNASPETYPALIRRLRKPGEVLPWVQPLDQFDSYKLINPFTGNPDRVTYLGQTWQVSQADGSGNNVWAPGVFGWVVV